MYKRPKTPLNKKQLEERALQEQEEIRRTPLPKDNQVFGIVEMRVGGSRMMVRCMDGKVRNCRIPGRLKNKLWVREGDLVIVAPWEFSGNEKGDVILKYKRNQFEHLRERGMLKKLDEFGEL
ncbi:translation initiation factor eIF-1A [Candidatus Woesearchaeota archaeon]|nr:translation initiation factor eIF-1A [Candidatus Woesearchaeota archaeon]